MTAACRRCAWRFRGGRPQRGDGTLDWAKTDAIIGAAAQHGIEVAPYLTGFPRWARSCKQNNCRAAGALGPDRRRLAAVRRRRGRPLRPRRQLLADPIGCRADLAADLALATLEHRQRCDGRRVTEHCSRPTYRTIKLDDPDAELVTGALSFAAGKGTVEPDEVPPWASAHEWQEQLLGGRRQPASHARSAASRDRSRRSARPSTPPGTSATGSGSRPIGWASDRRSSKADVRRARRAEEPPEVGDEVAPPRPRRRGGLLGALA